MRGTVKWFSDEKGFGFITPTEGDADHFFHQSEIQMEGRRTISEGQRVEFSSERGPKGLKALNVCPI